jgi:hypothetical protein
MLGNYEPGICHSEKHESQDCSVISSSIDQELCMGIIFVQDIGQHPHDP